MLREQQVAVLLVGVRPLRVLLDPDHPAPDRARLVVEHALEGEVGGRARRDVLLEGVVVEVLDAVGEVRAGDARGRARAGEVVLDPDLPLLRAEAAGDPVELGVALDPRVVAAEVPRLAADVLHRDVLDLGAVLDEDLDGGVEVAGELGRHRGVLLDHGDAAARLGDDQQPPEERAALDRVRDPHEQRLLEHDALRHLDEQAVLPLGRVVRGELLVRADELAQARMLGERLEADPVGGAVDLEPRLGDPNDPGGLELEHRRRGDDLGGAVRRERLRVEALQVGEAPRLVLRRRQRRRGA